MTELVLKKLRHVLGSAQDKVYVYVLGSTQDKVHVYVLGSTQDKVHVHALGSTQDKVCTCTRQYTRQSTGIHTKDKVHVYILKTRYMYMTRYKYTY